MKKIIILAVSFSICALSAKAEDTIQTQSQNSVEQQASKWSVEGMLQAQSVTGGASPVFGPSLSYKVSNKNFLGFRALASISKTGDDGAYGAQTFWRHLMSEKKTSLFTEASVAYNIVYTTAFPSAGLALGVLHQLNSDFAFGGLAGVEVANASVGDYYSYRTSAMVIYPKMALMGSLSF
jgi:opacity protein-like surface antigen